MKIIDMHSDTIMSLMDRKQTILDSNTMINLEKLQKGDYKLQCFATFVVYIDKKQEDYSPYDYCNQMMDVYYENINKFHYFYKIFIRINCYFHKLNASPFGISKLYLLFLAPCRGI